jgi:hypothetical protein
MAVMTTGHFGKLLWPGLNAIWGKEYDEHQTEYTDLFDTFKSNRHYEEDLGLTSFGLFNTLAEAAPVQYDSERQTYVTRYTHVQYALGFIISRIIYEDDLYDVVGERRAKGLAFSARQTKETVCANVYNRAFDSSYTGGDGLEMCSAAHVNWAGGTWSNELATAADISEASLEQACIDLMKFTDDRGRKISVMPQSLHIPVDLVFEVERILKSTGRVGTADNDLNAIKSLGKFVKGVKVNHYFTDTDAWFIRTNVKNGLKYFERRKDDFTQDNDFDTDNAKYKATMRFVPGWTDPRAIFGSPGA